MTLEFFKVTDVLKQIKINTTQNAIPYIKILTILNLSKSCIGEVKIFTNNCLQVHDR